MRLKNHFERLKNFRNLNYETVKNHFTRLKITKHKARVGSPTLDIIHARSVLFTKSAAALSPALSLAEGSEITARTALALFLGSHTTGLQQSARSRT